MATLNPYFTFYGKAGEAMKFYQSCFGGKLTVMTVKESPIAATLPKEFQDSMMHAVLETGRLRIMASDVLDGRTLIRGNDVGLMLLCESEAELRELFLKLQEGGSVTTPIQATFWNALYADITDRFGVRWMLNFDR